MFDSIDYSIFPAFLWERLKGFQRDIIYQIGIENYPTHVSLLLTKWIYISYFAFAIYILSI